jgi:HAD superfamily hydrolase (TIGR01459 family)
MRELAERYDGFIVDLWGVVHDGVKAYPGVADCLARLREAGKRVVFLSNAPRRADTVARALEAMEIGPELFTGVMSSGEAVHRALRDRTEEFAALGRKFVHLGPKRDRGLFAGLDLDEVADPAAADFLLNTGPDDGPSQQNPAFYADMLQASLRAGLPMVCANPDLEIVRDGQRIICAGLLAELYQEQGGRVIQRGKPDAAIYAPTLEMLGVPKNKVVAIGDSLRTDIAGAKAAGVDACWVLSGIHAFERLEDAVAEAAEAGLAPVAIRPAFAW